MKIKLILMVIVWSLLSSYTPARLDGKTILDKDIYSNSELVDICKYVNSREIFALRSKHLKDTILVSVDKRFSSNADKKPIIELKNRFHIYFFKIKNSVAVGVDIISTDVYSGIKLPENLLCEKENIYNWVETSIRKNKFMYNKSWNEYEISFRYYLFPEKE